MGAAAAGLEVDPDEPSPDLDCDVMKGQVLFVESVGLVEKWCRSEAAIEAIGPGVVGALDRAFERAGRAQMCLGWLAGGVGQL